MLLWKSIHYFRGRTGTVYAAVRNFVDPSEFLKLIKESVDFVFNFNAVFADGLTEDL